MAAKVAIIADDLTGALDTGTPFLEAGLSVVVAVGIDGIPRALETGADVVVVNTGSRALSADEAASRVQHAAAMLRKNPPQFILKKVDSRLKGNVGAECEAMARALGMEKLIVAPAIPDQQRYTFDAHVIGRGVAEPMPIAPVFANVGLPVEIVDAQSDADLGELIRNVDWDTSLLVGARGVGVALSRQFSTTNRPSAFVRSEATLFAFGSHDPITTTQMNLLAKSGLLAGSVEASAGDVPDTADISQLPLLMKCSGEITTDPVSVARRFATGVARAIDGGGPDVMMMGGGDTALAILSELGVDILRPRGEIEPGVPWFEITLEKGRQMRCAVKSGGFGNPHSLINVLKTAALEQQAS